MFPRMSRPSHELWMMQNWKGKFSERKRAVSSCKTFLKFGTRSSSMCGGATQKKFAAKHKRNSAEGKVAALSFLFKLVASLLEALGNEPPPPVGLCLLDENRCLQRVEICFTPQGVTDDWHRLASLKPATRELWHKLQITPWCAQRITSSFQQPTLVDILLFLFYLVGHPQGDLLQHQPL